MKWIKYRLLVGNAADGKEVLQEMGVTYSEENEQKIKGIAYKGEYTIEDDGYEKTNAEQITELKTQLATTDYKVIKCSECQLLGMEMPYDVAELHAERQAIRDQINKLEQAVN